jgi:molybdopterin converting factor small subunit
MMITVKVTLSGTTLKKSEEVSIDKEKLTVEELMQHLLVKYGDDFRREVSNYGILHLRNGASTQDEGVSDGDELVFIRPLSGG